MDQTTLSIHKETMAKLEQARVIHQSETGKLVKSWDEIIQVLADRYLKEKKGGD